MERRRLAGMASRLQPIFYPRKARKARNLKVAALTDGMARGLKSGATVPVVMVPLVFSC